VVLRIILDDEFILKNYNNFNLNTMRNIMLVRGSNKLLIILNNFT